MRFTPAALVGTQDVTALVSTICSPTPKQKNRSQKLESSNMNMILIVLLVGMAALAWFWFRKPGLKGAPPRTWPASRTRNLPKRKFVVPL